MGTQVAAGVGGEEGKKQGRSVVLEDARYSSSVVQLYWKSQLPSHDTQVRASGEKLQEV